MVEALLGGVILYIGPAAIREHGASLLLGCGTYRGDEAWDDIKAGVQYVTSNQLVTEEHCRSQLSECYSDFLVFRAFRSQPDFSDDRHGCVTGPAEEVESYFRAHEEARKFRNVPVDFFYEHYRLFGQPGLE